MSVNLYRNLLSKCSTNSRAYSSIDPELVERSKRVLDALNLGPSETEKERDVIVYTRNRICSKCNKNVKISSPEYLENACADCWRYFHNISFVPNCPMFGIMKFTKFYRLRAEQKIAISK